VQAAGLEIKNVLSLKNVVRRFEIIQYSIVLNAKVFLVKIFKALTSGIEHYSG